MINNVSVIIPTIGYSNNLKKLIESLHSQKASCSVMIRLVVNKCSKNEFDFINEKLKHLDSRIKFIYSQKSGVNIARNLGINESEEADLLIFLDDDCEIVSENLIEQHILTHRKEADLFALGGLYKTSENARFIDQLYNYIQMRWLYQGTLDDQLYTQYLIGGHFSIKNDQRKKHNLFFNEAIVYGGSELGFFLKAFELKLKMKLSEFLVQHNTSESFYSIAKKIFKQGKGKALTDQAFPLNPEIKGAHTDKSFFEKFLLTTYNYIFWYGYYSQKKDIQEFFKFSFKNLKGSYLFMIFNFKKKIHNSEISKKNRGDRF